MYHSTRTLGTSCGYSMGAFLYYIWNRRGCCICIITVSEGQKCFSEFCGFHRCGCGRRVCWKSVSGDLFWFNFMGLFSALFKLGRQSES